MRRKRIGNPLNTVTFRDHPFDPRDWAAYSNSHVVEALLDVLAAGDPHGDAALLSKEVTRRGLTELAKATARRRTTP